MKKIMKKLLKLNVNNNFNINIDVIFKSNMILTTSIIKKFNIKIKLKIMMLKIRKKICKINVEHIKQISIKMIFLNSLQLQIKKRKFYNIKIWHFFMTFLLYINQQRSHLYQHEKKLKNKHFKELCTIWTLCLQLIENSFDIADN